MSLISEITVQNYLKAIVKYLSQNNTSVITNGEIAKLLNVTPGTATSMSKKLEKEGFIKYKSHIGCTLTSKGQKYGLNILRRHRLIETFLFHTLKMNMQDIHNEAENIEHAASDKLIDIIDSYLGNPERDPHGALIPKKNQTEYITQDTPVSELSCGQIYKVIRLTGSEKLFKYYNKINLTVNSMITITEKDEDAGLAKIVINNTEVTCSTNILQNIFVSNK